MLILVSDSQRRHSAQAWFDVNVSLITSRVASLLTLIASYKVSSTKRSNNPCYKTLHRRPGHQRHRRTLINILGLGFGKYNTARPNFIDSSKPLKSKSISPRHHFHQGATVQHFTISTSLLSPLPSPPQSHDSYMATSPPTPQTQPNHASLVLTSRTPHHQSPEGPRRPGN